LFDKLFERRTQLVPAPRDGTSEESHELLHQWTGAELEHLSNDRGDGSLRFGIRSRGRLARRFLLRRERLTRMCRELARDRIVDGLAIGFCGPIRRELFRVAELSPREVVVEAIASFVGERWKRRDLLCDRRVLLLRRRRQLLERLGKRARGEKLPDRFF